MRDPFNADPLPKTLGEKVEQPQPMNPSQVRQLREVIFERSRWYDIEILARELKRQGR